MKKCENCGKIILFKARFIKLYGEKYIVCKNCQKLIRHFKKRHS